MASPTLLLAATLWTQAPTSAPVSLAELLAAPVSPGSVARLVEHGSDPAVLRRLGDAIRHGDPAVRAAGARVGFVLGAQAMVPYAATALSTESDVDAAAELVRLLVYVGGPAHRDSIVTAWSRLGANGAARSAAIYAAARGPDALADIDALRAVTNEATAIVGFVLAARPLAEQLIALLDGAIRAGDPPTYDALLMAAFERRLAVPDDTIVQALDGANPPDMRLAAASHLLRSWDGQRALSGAIKDALVQFASRARPSLDVRTRLVAELADRAGGRAPDRSREWNELLERPSPQLTHVLGWSSTRRLLTDGEIERLRRAYRRFGPLDRPAKADLVPPRLVVQTPDSYPPAFVRSVFESTGCRLAEARRRGIGAGAGILTLRLDGRPSQVSLVETGVTDSGCKTAVRVLLMTHVAALVPDTSGVERLVVIPLDADYVSCSASLADALTRVPADADGDMEPPQKIRHVDPVYPPSMVASRTEGTVVVKAVIASSGCVVGAHVVQGQSVALDLAAVRAVVDWRFRPTTIDSKPISVALLTTVRFSLQ